MRKKLYFTRIFSKTRIKYQLYLIYSAVIVIPVLLIGALLLAGNVYICKTDPGEYRNIQYILWICCAVFLFALMISAVIIHFFAGCFVERVDVLRKEVHKVSNQDYELIADFQGKDELSEAFADLQVMVKNIKEQEARACEAQIREKKLLIERQETEYKMLASQINPHFLYNTLETIRMKALAEGDREVAEAVKLLGKSMHYVLENMGASVTSLEREIEHVDVYMMIQRLRFGDRILYEKEVEEGLELSEYQFLPLLLQPVVENAILHGMEETEEGGLIRLSVYSKTSSGGRLAGDDQPKLLYIDVEDNGCGMSKEALEELRREIEVRDVNRNKSIGLYNINQRIRQHYGNGYHVHIYSKPGEGTLIRLIIPAEPVQLSFI